MYKASQSCLLCFLCHPYIPHYNLFIYLWIIEEIRHALATSGVGCPNQNCYVGRPLVRFNKLLCFLQGFLKYAYHTRKLTLKSLIILFEPQKADCACIDSSSTISVFIPQVAVKTYCIPQWIQNPARFLTDIYFPLSLQISTYTCLVRENL